MSYLLGIDLGTSSVKALVVDREGHTRGIGSAEYPVLMPQPDCAEQDPEMWWQSTAMAVRQAIAAVRHHEIAAIGLSGQMHGTVLLNEDGRPLAPAIIWPDRRSQAQVREITEQIGAERLIELTGSPIATGFQAATLRWVQQALPKVWRQVRHILLPKDYLRWRMIGGRFYTDPSDAAGTLLLDARTRDWSPVMLETLGLDAMQLPEVKPSTALDGALSHLAAEHLGLRPGIPVVVGAADTANSALAGGVVSPDTLLVTISTGGQLVLPSEDVRVDRRGRIHTFCSALEPAPGQAGWYQMAATLNAGMALRWLRDQVFALSAPDAYTQMSEWAQSVPLGARGLLFLPYLSGERSPHMDPTARGVFLGLATHHGRAEVVRAVMEGVAFSCYDAYQVLVELGARPSRVVMAGGGARSLLWQRIVADVFNLPVRRLIIAEQSALGAAILAGAGTGWHQPGEAASRWVAYDALIEPDERNHTDYQALLPIFRSAYLKHRDDFEILNRYSR
ncbi:MAG: xylulokinase [Anaerolineae bacterium]